MKIKKLGAVIFLSLALFVSSFSLGFAQTVQGGGPDSPCEVPGAGAGISSMIDHVTCILSKSVVSVIFALAFVYFFWGVVQYVLYPDDEGKKDKGRSMMIGGIIALTVMFSVYGLIRVFQATFGFDDDNTAVKVPKLPGQ